MKTHIILIFTFVLLNTGCKDTSTKADYIIKKNEQVSFELEANWSTGASWHWTNKEDVKSVDTICRVYLNNSNRRGGVGKEIWTFYGKKKGTSEVILENKRSSDENVAETKKIVFRVK